MTVQHTLKRLIRARMSETGESYSTARRHFRVYERKRAMSQELIDQCAKGNLEAVKTIVGEGADVNYRGACGNTPLGYSHYSGTEIMAFLLDSGARPNDPAYEDSTPVGLAAYEGSVKAVALLLERGADPNVANLTTGVTPLHEAVVKSKESTKECVSLLLGAGADPNTSTKQDVETNAFFESVRVYTECPLHWAAAYGNEETIRLLIEYGADASRKDGRGETPSQWAGRHQRPSQIRELLHNT